MQTNHKRLAGLLSASALVLGMIAAQQASAGIKDTRHNLGSSNRDVNGLTTPTNSNARDGDVYTTATDEVCVFCHTPHGGEASVAPLWNKGLPNAANYTVYSSGTMQGTAALSASNMSLACLSCHDGTQAMDNMINAPGSNGYVSVGATLGASTAWSNTVDTVNGAMNGKSGNQEGVDLSSFGVGVFMLGTDLRNDHPVGIPYCGGNSASVCNDSSFSNPLGASALVAPGFYAGTYSATTRMNIRLYATPGNTTNPYGTTVECGSCHDPHNETEKTFLRISNAGSALCSSCHTK